MIFVQTGFQLLRTIGRGIGHIKKSLVIDFEPCFALCGEERFQHSQSYRPGPHFSQPPAQEQHIVYMGQPAPPQFPLMQGCAWISGGNIDPTGPCGKQRTGLPFQHIGQLVRRASANGKIPLALGCDLRSEAHYLYIPTGLLHLLSVLSCVLFYHSTVSCAMGGRRSYDLRPPISRLFSPLGAHRSLPPRCGP